jgi:hexosaminidase
VRRMERAARSVLPAADGLANNGSARDLAELRSTLTAWAENDSRLRPSGELTGLSKNLSILGSIGLQALEYLRPGQTQPAGWIEQQMALMKEIERPEAEVNLAAVRPVRILLEAAARRDPSGGNK